MTAGTCLRAPACQAMAVVVAFASVAALHWSNDGLWFGDAPIHAASGLFWWDLLAAWPDDPVAFAVSYFARYPAIQPTTYPPLFYLAEGLAFAVAGASPHVAKVVVLSASMAAGFYTMAWGRRWIGPAAGWSGAFLAFLPGIVVWSNAVMLNMPATALGIGSLYHFRRWLDGAGWKQLTLSVGLMAAVLLTYYPGAIAGAVVAALAVLRRRDLRLTPWMIAGTALAAACASVPLAISVVFSPVHTARHIPTASFLTNATTWLLYWTRLPDVVGWPALIFGVIGGSAGFWNRRWRTEVIHLALWFAVLLGTLSLLPARDPRYILLAGPVFVLAGAVGIATAADRFGAPSAGRQAAVLAVALAVGFGYAARVPVPRLSGFREIALYLRQHAPHDAVLYDGPNSAHLAFYTRAFDPRFDRRITEARTVLYHYGPDRTFSQWKQTSRASSTQEVLDFLRHECSCRWIALEDWAQREHVAGRTLLRNAVQGGAIEFVRTFPTAGTWAGRVDLYRVKGELSPAATLDLTFPSFNERTFREVSPITR